MPTPRSTAFLSWLDEQHLPESETYPCPYLPDRRARQFGFTVDALDGELYEALLDRGMRRSGRAFYGMCCPACRLCLPLRVPVDTFRASRSQRRVLRRNRDVRVAFAPPRFRRDSFALYRRYLHHQHPGTPQDDSEESFRDILYTDVTDGIEARYLIGDRLVGVSLLDVCPDSLSAVYHFFEPTERRRSIGVLSVLLEIEHARATGARWYHLGYWIKGARSMQYKADYRPHELLRDGTWRAPAPD